MSATMTTFPSGPALDADATEIPGSKRSSWLAAHGLGPLDTVAIVVALLLCVAYGSFFVVPGWTPRVAVLLVTLPLGLALVAIQATRRDPIALTSALLIGAATLSGILSGHTRSTLLGTVGTEESVLILAGSMGLMALGRQLSEQGRRAVGWAVVSGVALSCAVGLLQLVAQADAGIFALLGGRPSGFTPNPVYFGAAAAGAFGIVVGRRSTNSRTVRLDMLLACWFGIAIVISGTRVALGAAVVVAVVAIATRRSARAMCSSAGMVVGVMVGSVITSTIGTGTNAVDRMSGGGEGSRGVMWRYASEAFLERPVFGWGYGEFRTAVQSHISPEVSKGWGPSLEQQLFDAHNVVAGHAVSLGAVGLFGLVALVALVACRARGGLALGALALSLSWLLQPMGLATFPVAMLLVGAALPAVPKRLSVTSDSLERPRGVHPALMWLLVPGIAAGLYLAVVDVSIRWAADHSKHEQVASLVELLPPDPVLADLVAQSFQEAAMSGDASASDQALAWSQRTIQLQDDRSRWWIRHAVRQATFGSSAGALESLGEARRLEPNSWRAVELQLILLDKVGDTAERELLMPLGCQLGVPSCEIIDEN